MIKQEDLYQNKVNSSVGSIHNCKIKVVLPYHYARENDLILSCIIYFWIGVISFRTSKHSK